MGAAGIFAEDDRVKLLGGEIVQVTPIGSRHAACVARLTELLMSRIGEEASLRVQRPIRLDDHSEPQPDIAIVLRTSDFYEHAHTGSDDVLLLIEVAETSLELDRQVKLPLCARAGIREVWIVDLGGKNIEVYRQPSAEGYAAVMRSDADPLTPEAFPHRTLSPRDLLPPAWRSVDTAECR